MMGAVAIAGRGRFVILAIFWATAAFAQTRPDPDEAAAPPGTAACSGCHSARSGFEDMSRDSQAMQQDDTVNPGMLWVLDGETLWGEKSGSGRSCADCHGDARPRHADRSGSRQASGAVPRPGRGPVPAAARTDEFLR